MAVMNSLTFGGINSLNYGIYITGEGVYNAPERAVDTVSVPGRNGDVIIDQGRYENVTIVYKAGTFGDDQSNFRTKISAFRNAILSKIGYQRLTDTYHPDEYRMGLYSSGLEVDPVHYSEAGEFELKFYCKPQRFLTSGETAVAVANNGSISNPTLYEASPLLEFKGYGDISLDGNTIIVHNEPYGRLLLANRTTRADANWQLATFLDVNNLALMNNGDTVSVSTGSDIAFSIEGEDFGTFITSATYSSGDITPTITVADEWMVHIDPGALLFAKNTSSSHTLAMAVSMTYYPSGVETTWSGTVTLTISYNGSDKISYAFTGTLPNNCDYAIPENSAINAVYGNSTKSLITNTMYIDLDIGEAYINNGGTLSSVDNMVSIPNKLPKLAVGSTTVTYDNTITNFKITPRWWQL